ncbi:Outer membrane usher protein fimD precursor [Raoultella planticola]|uniref:Outer membrane usher protein fimD n=1 Tax=Raoultella planticola TaxID=575 RepID=A0A485BMT9_RAOPL|nr:Outer membrane usher protein fimD precursor [Raoultella planticola]
MSHLKYGSDRLGARHARRRASGSARVFARFPLALLLAMQAFSAQAELYFNPRFLADDPAAVADLSSFEKGQEVPPGTYRVDIYLNNGFMTTRDVTFKSGENHHGLAPCLTRGQLASMGVNTAAVAGMNALAADACVPMAEMIKESTSRFDVGQQRLYLTVPQAFYGQSCARIYPARTVG